MSLFERIKGDLQPLLDARFIRENLLLLSSFAHELVHVLERAHDLDSISEVFDLLLKISKDSTEQK